MSLSRRSFIKSAAGSAMVALSGTGTVYNIGIIDETQMEFRRIINDETTPVANPFKTNSMRPDLRVLPIHRQNCLIIEFYAGYHQPGPKSDT